VECRDTDPRSLVVAAIKTFARHSALLIRKELVRLVLDWDAPPYPEQADRVPEPIEVRVVGAERVDPNKR
jgi:hypothetical protein